MMLLSSSVHRAGGRLPLLGLLLLLPLANATASPTQRPPNIIFILADDLGYVDVNRYAERITGTPAAQQYYETPNLDRLGREGISFAQAYASPLCSPTRAGLITGRNAAKIGVMAATGGNVHTYYNQGLTPPAGYSATDAILWEKRGSFNPRQPLLQGTTLDALPSGQPLDQGRNEVTFAEALTGYRSAFLGKWHLGSHGSKGWQPGDQGFEELAYLDEGSSFYFDWRKLWDRQKKIFEKMPQAKLHRGKTDSNSKAEYLTDALTETAVNFIRQQVADEEAKPFLLYFCQFGVHAPFQAHQEDIAYFQQKPAKGWNGHTNATYAAMLRSLDQSVGRILDVLAETGSDQNTIVVFMSDNGGLTHSTPVATTNAPLKGGKAMLYEGGIRVPLIFRWPGRIPADQWSDVPVTYEDVFPTLLNLAGIEPQPHYERIDGRSLYSLFTDPSNQRRGYTRDTFYWHYPLNVVARNPEDGLPLAPHSAMREGDYKLIFDWSGRLLLYNIKQDFREQHNLAEEMPEKAQDLFAKLNRWVDQSVAAKYTPALNPSYDPKQAKRPTDFVDLRKTLLGPGRAIRSAKDDPQLSARPSGSN